MSSPSEVVSIDGSTLEGGGQILRNAVSLSSLLRKPIRISKIRNGRNPPGLKNQHRVGLELAAQITSGTLLGASNKSQEIEYAPGEIRLPGEFRADAVTAGSVTLLLQVSLPLLLFSSSSSGSTYPSSESQGDAPAAEAQRGEVRPSLGPPSTLTLLGGTNASQAPQIDYTQHVFLPFLGRHFGLEEDAVQLDVRRRGYFPKGGGEVVLTVRPLGLGTAGRNLTLKACSVLERGKVKKIGGIAHYSKLPTKIGEEMVRGARRVLAKAGYGRASHAGTPDEVQVDIRPVREPNAIAVAGGSGIVLWAELSGGGVTGGSAVGRKGVEPEAVGAEAAEALVRGLDNGGCVDEWLQDQIVLFMALAEGVSEVNCGRRELELHTRTAMWLAEQLTEAKFEVRQDDKANFIVRCTGIGYTPP